MKDLKITKKEWHWIEKVIEEMKENTSITIRIKKTGQILVYKSTAD